MKKSYFGFTLIELLIVVAIIGILAAIAIPNFLQAQTRAKVVRMKADMTSIATALEVCRIDKNRYVAACRNPIPQCPMIPRILRLNPLTTPIKYISTIPGDIFNQTNTELNRFPLYQDRDSYFDPAACNQGQSCSGLPQFYYNQFFEQEIKGAQWLLRSRGPTSQVLGSDIPFGVARFYDPTNGTISLGNIVRVGPGSAFPGQD